MTTTIDGLANQATTEAVDLFVLQNVAANRTRNIKYSDLINEIATDLNIVNAATLASTVATLRAEIAQAKREALELTFPVGCKITNSVHSTGVINPATTLGFGTWVREGGRYYVGSTKGTSLGSITNFSFERDAGGTVGLLTHNHGYSTGGTTLNLLQIPSHHHSYRDTFYTESSSLGVILNVDEFAEPRTNNFAGVGSHSTDYDNNTFFFRVRNTDENGFTQPHSHTINTVDNIPHSMVEIVWRRTA